MRRPGTVSRTREYAVRCGAALEQVDRPDFAHADVQQRLAAAGAEVAGGTPEQFASLLKRETASWTKVIEHSGIKLE